MVHVKNLHVLFTLIDNTVMHMFSIVSDVVLTVIVEL